MRISVIVPAFNEEQQIAGCLEALKAQTVVPDEIIVVDNNSSDKTAEIAKAHGATVVFEARPGITPARNAGFNKASGDILARCDADTRPYPDWLERIKAHFEADKAGVLVGVTGTSDFYNAPPRRKRLIEGIFTWSYFAGNRLLLGHEAFYGSNMGFRRSIWLKIRDEVHDDDGLVHEDIDLSIHAIRFGKIIYDPELMVACAYRVFDVNPMTFIRRLAKWPRTRLVHTRFRYLVHASKKHSSTAQNRRK